MKVLKMTIKSRLERLEKSLAPRESRDCAVCGYCLCLKTCRRCEPLFQATKEGPVTISTYDPSKGIPPWEYETCKACGRTRATSITFNIARTTGSDSYDDVE